MWVLRASLSLSRCLAPTSLPTARRSRVASPRADHAVASVGVPDIRD